MKATHVVSMAVVVLAICLTLAPCISGAAVADRMPDNEASVPAECLNEVRIFGRGSQLEECLAEYQPEPESNDVLAAFKADFEDYTAKSDAKAFALAEDSSGTAAWGYVFEAADITQALGGAMENCKQQALRFEVQAECQIVAIGDALVGASDDSESPTPESIAQEGVVYGTRWIEGTEFRVGVSGETQVWLSPQPSDHQLLVYMVNGADRSVTFAPQSIRVKAFRNMAKGVQETSLQTFSAGQWEKKVQTRQAWAAALAGAAAGMANQPQAQNSSVYGNYSSYGSSYNNGSYYGTITTWPSAQDYAEANARTQAQVRAMGTQLKQSFQAMASTLMRTHTFAPDSFYGGVVVYKKQKADKFLVTIPFAGVDFEFEFGK